MRGITGAVGGGEEWVGEEVAFFGDFLGTQHSFYTSLGEAFSHPFQPTCKHSHLLRLFM